ncbi:hypothetical protein RND81_04G011500 [Saponaria officinalis]|uniref:SWIM-type domain-containing protein n=1 Tax=Saponaria officinalis TaxID=3572 RepID=A0AAW1LGM0_SAPOF
MRNPINKECRKGRTWIFFFAIQRDVNGALLNIFWVDARCRAMYKAFGDPVSYDTTFLNNKYRMPFSPFVGLNHHGSTIIFAAALVSYEDTETFEWMFEKWIECMGRAPRVMLTDQCKAMEGALRKNLRSHPQLTRINWDMRTLVHESTTEEEFLNMWAEMVVKYHLQQNTWMDTFCAGMSSMQRSEQSNRNFKTFASIETGLKQFIDQFEFALKRKADEENVLNFADKNSLGFVKMFRATSKVVDPFWKKGRWCFDVSIDTKSGEYKCGCKLFEFKGILCMHIIKCPDVMDVNVIPGKYILACWRMDLLIKTLEAHVGIENVDAFGEGAVSTRVWGRRSRRSSLTYPTSVDYNTLIKFIYQLFGGAVRKVLVRTLLHASHLLYMHIPT